MDLQLDGDLDLNGSAISSNLDVHGNLDVDGSIEAAGGNIRLFRNGTTDTVQADEFTGNSASTSNVKTERYSSRILSICKCKSNWSAQQLRTSDYYVL